MLRLVGRKVLKFPRYLLLLLALIPSLALGLNIQFQRFPVIGDGVDNISAVRATLQDKHGFIWFGGENGLARYDGHTIVLYQAEPDNPRSLSGNYIWSMAIDHDQVIWIGTWHGLNRYDPATDSFDHFTFDPDEPHSISNNDIFSLAVDQDNNLIIGTGDGLNILNPERTHFTRHYHAPQSHGSLGHNLIQTVFVDSQNRIWVGTNSWGLNLFDRGTGKFTAFKHDPENPASLIDNDVYAIQEDHLGRLWVGTQNRGLSRMNPDGKTFVHYRHNPKDPSSLASDQVADLHEDSRQNLWVALDRGGLALYQPHTDSFINFTHNSYDLHSISSNHPRNLFEDRQGDLWVGMFPGGVNHVDQTTTLFTNYSHKPNDPSSLMDSGILCFFEDSEGILWVGTEFALHKFDRGTGKFTRYIAQPEEQHGQQFGAVLSIAEDVSGELWIGTWSGGLYRFNKRTETFHNYYPDASDPNSINSEYVWKVLRDKDNTIWLATGTGGLNRYNPGTDNFTHFTVDTDSPNSIISNRVWTARLDSQGYLWLGTLNGLDRFNRTTQEFVHFRHDPENPASISSNHVVALFEDSRERLWVGTRDGGVNILDRERKAFQTLGVRDGLPSNSVSSIIEDDQANIWITAVNGIARIHPDTLAVSRYNESHGLISKNYNRDATFKDKNGRLYVGGTDGFSVFLPSELIPSEVPPPVVITDFRIFNQSVPIGEKDSILPQSITETDQLTLSYWHTMFSFDFAALSYRSPHENQYAYMLEGFDQQWNEIGNKHTATYTNIQPGRYTFRVKAANRDGVWNHEGASIIIEITPPWWRTTLAYLGYILAFLSLIYIANAYKTLRVKSDVYRTLSSTDPLTGISNRAAISEIAKQPFIAQQIAGGIGLLVIDIDHFKDINDQLGHDAGDRILKEFATLVSRSVRTGDSFARWGGEEFVLLCFNITQEGLMALAEKLRKLVAAYPFEKATSPLTLTVSIGVACALPDDHFEAVFKRADTALYKAKQAGRNQVVLAD